MVVTKINRKHRVCQLTRISMRYCQKWPKGFGNNENSIGKHVFIRKYAKSNVPIKFSSYTAMSLDQYLKMLLVVQVKPVWKVMVYTIVSFASRYNVW